jgi:hypothetical protein
MTDFHHNLGCLIPNQLCYLGYELPDRRKTQQGLFLLMALCTPGFDRVLDSGGDGFDQPPGVGPSPLCKMSVFRA